MKNKQNAKDRRQQVSTQKTAMIAAKEQQRQKKLQEEADRLAAEKKAKRHAAFETAAKEYLADNPPDARSKKSGPKAAGVKSLFMLKEGEMLMTSFGKGNDAVQEKVVRSGVIENLQEKPAFSAEPEKKGYVVSGRMTHDAMLDDPSQSAKKPGDDLIGLRKQFEELYFGETFEDNIHIQLIYNILDIEKILSIHINNIIYEINNLFRRDGEDRDDLFQSMSAGKTYENFIKGDSKAKELFEELMKDPRRAYFGDVIFRPQKKIRGKGNAMAEAAREEAEKKRCYNLLALLATTRHSLAHGKSSVSSIIYQLDNAKSGDVKPEALTALDALYAGKVNFINKDFFEHAKQKNLPVLFEGLDVTEQKRKEQIVRDYYDFTVRKEYKNQGFSIKKLREILLNLPDAKELTEQKYDSVRSKLYMLFDFVIFDWYRHHQEDANELVNNLRSALTEEDKLHFYMETADVLWADIRPAVMDHIAVKLSESYVTTISALRDDEMNESVLNSVRIGDNASRFSKLMYLLTCFQDGKEINDLLTTLINKFENIASFMQVLQERGLPCDFKKEFKMFANSQTIAKELRTINAFARMGKADTATKATMFYDAAYLLGFNDDDEQLTEIIKQMLDPNNGKTSPNGNGFRNFIINNVIESRRFQYLVRYGNPKKLCKVMRNKKVVAFVLKDIPDAQIVRYYNSCTNSLAEYRPEMRGKLTELLLKVDFTNFELIRTDKNASALENVEKERQKAIVRLYLTVLYLLVKNLVYVNSRYFLAFHCVERDAVTYDSKKYASLGSEKSRLRDFAAERVEQGTLNKRATCYVKQNIANSDPLFIAEFRNAVDHMNVVRNADQYINDIAKFDSYFELYHYLLQRSLIDSYRYGIENGIITAESVNPKSLEYMELVEKYHTYCKDMVKALNVPFAYNLPRYKNLSINELFDRNHYLPDAAGKDAIQSE
jgi:hypothetical protein